MKPSFLRRFLKWLRFIVLEGDILYTVLPILVYAIVRFVYFTPFNNFWGIPEWSFASIVFFGLSIRRTTQLRRAYETSLSDRLSVRIQSFVFLLVGAVLALALAIANEGVPNVNYKFIVGMQQFLFWLGIVCLVLTLLTEKTLPAIRDTEGYYLRLEDMLTTIEGTLYVFAHLATVPESVFEDDTIYRSQAIQIEKSRDELRVVLQRIENSIRILREAHKTLSQRLEEPDVVSNTMV